MSRRAVHRFALAARLLALAAGVLLGAPAWAHDAPARTVSAQAGPYALTVKFFTDPPHVEAPLEFAVSAAPGGPPLSGVTLQATALPGLGTDATVTRTVTLAPEAAEPGSYAGALSLVTRGAWNLRLAASSPAGQGEALVPLQVAAPAAIPGWLGWLIGLAPLLGLAWFARWNVRYLRRLKTEG